MYSGYSAVIVTLIAETSFCYDSILTCMPLLKGYSPYRGYVSVFVTQLQQGC